MKNALRQEKNISIVVELYKILKQKSFKLFSDHTRWIKRDNFFAHAREILFKFKKELIIVIVLVFITLLFLF